MAKGGSNKTLFEPGAPKKTRRLLPEFCKIIYLDPYTVSSHDCDCLQNILCAFQVPDELTLDEIQFCLH